MDVDFFHQPVLVDKVTELLVTKRDKIYVDCTLGGGGHAEKILRIINKKGILVCLDADSDAIAFAAKRLASYPNKILHHIFYDQLDVVLLMENLLPVQGVLFDVGLSSYLVNQKARGFSFREDGPLDMRFDQRQGKSAKTVLNEYSEEQIGQIIRDYGEEKNWKKIAQKVCTERSISPLINTMQLKNIVKTIVGERFLTKSLSRVFQAIRIEVNNELDRLRTGLDKAFKCLAQNGRIAVITYHSLETKIVKDFFRNKEISCLCPPDYPHCVCTKKAEMRILTRKSIKPDRNEITQNKRARSAQLRVAEKIVAYKSIV
jgi:16S rRNA (cytosine1402-N4)-methyltransferase